MELVAVDHLSLDGVMQAPGRPDEDTRDGFDRGGWAVANSDEIMARAMGGGMASGAPLLFGRRTYQDFHSFWPHQEGNPFKDVLDHAAKYVASTTLREPLPWQNSTLLEGDAVEAVARLKHQQGGEMVVLGSGELVRSLIPHRLIDRFVLMIHPLVLGTGRRLFPDDMPHLELKLADSVTTTKGVLIGTYELA
ncbi:MAG: dihydrofolate reductase family protein [Actinomycetota bacterium]